LVGVDQPLFVRRATSDFWVLEEIYENGEYAAVKQLNLPPNAGVIDLGANIGLASRYLANLLPESRIVAVEPDRGNCEMIECNCRELIDNGRLIILQAFAAANAGLAAIDRTCDSYGFAKVPADDRPQEELVPCLPLSSIIARLGRLHVDLLKCDIEGSEAELFELCHSWIGRVRHIIVETHAPYSLSALIRHLRSGGWQFDVLSSEEKQDRALAVMKQRMPAPAEVGH
jgi:FkbM family methyltransferase